MPDLHTDRIRRCFRSGNSLLLLPLLSAACSSAPWPQGSERAAADAPALFALVGAERAWVQPLALEGRHLVVGPEWTSIVDERAGWIRHLDQTGAMLEGCQVVRRGRAVECYLDLTFGPPVRFDAEGDTTDERFTPAWTR